MKGFLLKTIFAGLIVLILFPVTCWAQVSVRSAGLDFGWYKPAMDYWNERSSISSQPNKFNGSFMGDAHMVLNLYRSLKSRFEFGYWRESVKNEGVQIGVDTGDQEVSITVMPLTTSLAFYVPMNGRLEPYAGVGGSAMFIRKTFISAPTNTPLSIETDSGFDYSMHLMGGVEVPIARGLMMGLELRYVFGNYIQEIENSQGQISEEEVSITGPQFRLSWIYLFSGN